MLHQHKLTDEQELEVCQRYADGLSCERLAPDYSVNHVTILNILKRHNIPRRSAGGHRTYKMNHAFFSTITNERQAYWLGFLAADAYVYKTKLVICLAAKDSAHLAQFIADLDSDYPVHSYLTNDGHPAVKVNITSAQLTTDLVRHGVWQAKSANLPWPDTVPDALLCHLARGYFDGNGSFVIHTDSEHRTPNPTFTVTGSWNFITGLQELLVNACDLKFVKLIPYGKVVTLRYAGRNQVKRIFDFMYTDATVCLDRKRSMVAPNLFDYQRPYERKLTPEQVNEIKRRIAAGETRWAIFKSHDYPVCHSVIYKAAVT